MRGLSWRGGDVFVRVTCEGGRRLWLFEVGVGGFDALGFGEEVGELSLFEDGPGVGIALSLEEEGEGVFFLGAEEVITVGACRGGEGVEV